MTNLELIVVLWFLPFAAGIMGGMLGALFVTRTPEIHVHFDDEDGGHA